MEELERPKWQVYHPKNLSNRTVTLSGTISTGIGVTIKRYLITETYTESFSSSTEVHDSWERPSSTVGAPYFNTPNIVISDGDWASYSYSENQGQVIVTGTTYTYEYIAGGVSTWAPAPTDEIKTAYSLHLYDPLASGSTDFQEKPEIKPFPNPTSSEVLIALDANKLEVKGVTIINISGQECFENLAKVNPSHTA